MSKQDKALEVICPVCSAWKGKQCKHTKGSRKGTRRDQPHEDRVRLSKAKVPESMKRSLDEIQEKPTKKNPREKLTSEQKEVVKIIAEKIEVLGKHAEFVGPVTVGPIISTYRFLPMKRTKVAHLEIMAKDFAVALGSEESILVKRMPGESAVGVFVPNKERTYVNFPDTLENVGTFMGKGTRDKHIPIPLNFGMNSNGDAFVDDLTMQPHLLIAGTTGSGKSTVEHAITLSMAWHMSPDQLKLIISDTKGVEFKAFQNLPHLQFPICTNVYKTMEALEWCVQETQKRLDRIGHMNVRNIHEHNLLVPKEQRIPFVVIIIDEMADIMGPALERVEAQANSAKLAVIVGRSRASGIHVVAATQRPDVRLIKGSIKANFASRLSFRLPSQQDSRTVLSTKGAENLMSRGDMLYNSSMSPELKRLHAPYTSLEDVKTTVEGIIARYLPQPDVPEDELRVVQNSIQ